MIVQLLLDDTAKDKLHLFTCMEKKETTFFANSLLADCDFSYTKIQSLLDTINQDMLTLYNRSLFSESGKIIFDSQLFDSGSYRTYLLNKSISYQFLLNILINPEDQLVDFCESHYLSRATIHRKMRMVKEYLSSQNVNLNLTGMTLSGSESFIRTFYFHLSWLATSGNDILELEYIQASFAKFEDWQETWDIKLCQIQIHLLLAISQLRLEQGYTVETTDFSDYYFPQVHPTIQSFFDHFALKENTQAEISFFYFQLLYLPLYLTKDDPRISIVEKNLHQLNLVDTLPGYLQTYIETVLDKTLGQEATYLLNLNFNNLFARLNLRKKSPTFSFFQNHTSSLLVSDKFYHKINRKFLKLLNRMAKQEEFLWLKNCLPELADHCTLLILPYVKRENKADYVSIGIQNDPNHFLIQEIIDFCTKFPFVKYELFSDYNQNKYDLIISNTTPSIQIFTSKTPFFSLQHGAFSYGKLLELFEKTLQAKQ